MMKLLGRLIFPCICMAVLAWFHWNSENGHRGEMQIAQTEQKIARARLELEGMRAERDELAKKVELLRAEALDPDLLGIQARKMLQSSHPDELIVYFPAGSSQK
ncbi:MAG: septum formation initiator family protein [Pseudomonadota bacterium]